MAGCLDQGLAADSEQMQQAVQEHYNFCLKFWKPTREAYKSLAMSYVLPSDYRDSYENVREGLGKYIYDAVIEFADQNLA
ncbi:MAG TPA: TipAS antibiotic-recognition domain-containing protein, partial [Candidatus Aquiluna sp.]|nr:TipAS antibiotic-recognition domain-containing protein [Aquiluna sp.]